MSTSDFERETQTLIVTKKTEIAQQIWALELARPDGAALPVFEAGAHVAVQTPAGARRHYSLANDPQENTRYLLAIKQETEGRGGSSSLIDSCAIGDALEVSLPGNNFQLQDAPQYILIAGGIGITPILSMAYTLARKDRPFQLIYCTRSPQSTAFLEVLENADFQDRVTVHHDNGDPAQVFDFWDLLATPTTAHIYCCGPGPLMEEVRGVTGHWPSGSVHFEDFGSDIEALRADDHAFTVTDRSSGRSFEVAAGETILDALRSAGVDLRSSCESGTCGTCKVRLIDGQPDHRDIVLSDEEKKTHIMICVSRAKGDALVIDWPHHERI